jgi:hypothetical protein
MWNDLWTGLKWIAKAFFALVIVAIVLLPLLAMTELNLSASDLLIPAGLSESWVVLVLLMLSLFLVYLVWRILRVLLLRPFGSWGVFGGNVSARLIALGLTALFIPRPVEKLVLLPPTILFRLVESLGRRASGLSGSVGARPDEALVNVQVPVMRLAVIIPDILAETARILTQAFDGALTAEMVVAIALWILAGNLLSAAGSSSSVSTAGLSGSRLSRFIKSMTATQQHGVVLIAVFLLGAYLSIAAIVAIPWLHEEKVSPGLTQESLVKMLNSILPVATPGDSLAQGDTAAREDPLAPLADYLKDETKTKRLAPETVTALQAVVRDSKTARAGAVLRLQQIPQEISRRVAQMRQAAMSAFELETATLMSNQERGSFMRQIQQTITEDYRRLDGAQAQCAAALSDTDRELRDLSQGAIQLLDLEGVNAQADSISRSSIQQISIVLRLRSKASYNDSTLREACDTLNAQNTVYTAPAAGTGWGPFGAVARWLLQTKSVPLALITGMLGFGLLGSAIATFVRTGPTSSKASLTAEVTSVIVRGLSAAVVVFLAVKGGLAVFSSGDAEPNAYVVFLTCLVGAVFSEDVWAWARAKFLDNFQHRDGGATRKTTMAEAIEETATGQGGQPGSTNVTPPAPLGQERGPL